MIHTTALSMLSTISTRIYDHALGVLTCASKVSTTKLAPATYNKDLFMQPGFGYSHNIILEKKTGCLYSMPMPMTLQFKTLNSKFHIPRRWAFCLE